MNYLLDTCVISDLLKKHPQVCARMESCSPQSLSISTISVMEVEYGLALHPERMGKISPIWTAFQKLISIESFTVSDAIAAAQIRSLLKKQGNLIGPYDLLLAGMAFAREWTLVSSNCREFERVKGLAIEDWRLS